jgi:serine/threonine protein kinase
MHQICLALAAAHNARVFHRDVKPDNIVLDASDNVILIDWASGQIDVHDPRDVPRVAGHGSYRAPECNSDQTELTPDVLAAGDVWSAGCVFYEMLHGAQLFTAPVTETSVMSFVPAVPSMLKQMLAWAPCERPSASRVAQWFLEHLT